MSVPSGSIAAMRYSINLPNFGELADPHVVAGLAKRAEDAGWDGFFVWDHVHYRKHGGKPFGDAWLLLAWLALPLAVPLVRTVRERTDGPSLNGALAGTGALLGIFSLTVSTGLLIAA